MQVSIKTRSPRVTQKNSRGQRSSKGHVWADSKLSPGMIGEWVLWLQMSITPLRTGGSLVDGRCAFDEIAMAAGTYVCRSTRSSFYILGANETNLFARAEAGAQDWGSDAWIIGKLEFARRKGVGLAIKAIC